ncbi:hypothetical protein ABE237_25430 [Brevibacillus formosus]|uniref:phage scaffolding protein n=1 Tax=Brevibacillus formosus TaxID=54913 RepID=UPI0018CE20F5|nr:hypothetical protein [Brevibacillus formosus]MBG9940581.1 hypothetical protein [Brevibacillus formosus]
MEQVEQTEEQVADIETQAEPEKTFTQADIDAMKTEWDRQLKETQTALQQQTVQHAFYRKATEQGVADADKLLQYVNLSSVTFDESGQPQGIDEIIAALTSVVGRPKVVEPKIVGGPSNFPPQDRSPQAMLDEAAELARRTGRPEHLAAYSTLRQKLFGGK